MKLCAIIFLLAIAVSTAEAGSKGSTTKKLPRSGARTEEDVFAHRSNGDKAFQQFFKGRGRKKFDLDGIKLTFPPGGGKPCVTSVTQLPYTTTTDVGLDDPTDDYTDTDDSVSVSIGFTFTFFGEAYTSVFVGSNGYLTFGEPDFDFTPKTKSFNAIPRIAGLFTDLMFGLDGSVTFSSSSSRFVVTYSDMTHFDDFEFTTVNMQIALFPDGTVEIIHEGTDIQWRKIKSAVGMGTGVKRDKKKINLSNANGVCDETDPDPTPDPGPEEPEEPEEPEPTPCQKRKAASLSRSSVPGKPRTVAAIEPRIVGGEEATIGRYPYQAWALANRFSCGASLISRNAALCAAHCEGIQEVWVGGHNTNNEFEFKVARVKQNIPHEQYNSRTSEHDIMVLIFEDGDEIDDVQPVVLDRPQSLGQDNVDFDPSTPNSSPLRVMGWGALSSGGRAPDELQQVDVDYVTNTACDNAYRPQGAPITDDMICAAAPGKDSCQGDSGGPLIVPDAGGDPDRDVQVGVVSWGFGCADPDFPGVYSRVAEHFEWIKGKVGNGLAELCP